MMIIDISKGLKHPGQSFEFSTNGNVEDIDVYGDNVSIDNPVDINGVFMNTGGNFYIRGNFTTKYATTCALCGDKVIGTVECDFDEEFDTLPDEDHPDRYTYAGNNIDIAKMVYDLICLELPLKHVCNDDCMGLCPVCGARLNDASCECNSQVEDSSYTENQTKKDSADNPFAALKDLITE